MFNMREDDMKVRYKFNEISTDMTHVHLMRDNQWLQVRLGSHSDFNVRDTIDCEMEFFRDEKCVYLSGSVMAEAMLVCVKCLDTFKYPVNKDFKSVFFNTPEFHALPEERELTEETLNEEFLYDNTLDLEDVLMEELLLSIPDYPRCSEECKGLCPVCGTNLNHHICGCNEENKSSPFDVLKNLLDR